MSVWVQSISTHNFEACLRESRTFDGPHSNLNVVCHEFTRNNTTPIGDTGEIYVKKAFQSMIFPIFN